MIPRALHWIWLGSTPIPEDQRAWIEGWRRRHPAWEARIWSEAELMPLRNQDLYDRSTSWSQRSDIARYELLFRHGGVYLDTDVECIRPLDDLVLACDAFAGEERPGLIGSAVLGATAGHPWLGAVVDAMPSSMGLHFLTMEQTGPDFLTRVTAGRADVTILKREVLYPVSSTGDDVPIGPTTVAVHHFAKSWADEERARITNAAVAALDALIPVGVTVVLVGGGLEIELRGRATVPFVVRDGVDWGAPAGDPEALLELDRRRDEGIEWFVFLPSAFWWLDHYTQLALALRGDAIERREDPTIAVFRLPPTRDVERVRR